MQNSVSKFKNRRAILSKVDKKYNLTSKGTGTRIKIYYTQKKHQIRCLEHYHTVFSIYGFNVKNKLRRDSSIV